MTSLSKLTRVNPILRGDYEKVRFVVMKEDGSGPLDITGWHFRFGAKTDLSDTTPLIIKDSDTAGNFDIVDPANGMGYIVFEGDETADTVTYELTLICDIQGTDQAGKATTGRFLLPVELDVSE